MNDLLDLVAGSLDSAAIHRLGEQIGATPAQAGSAVATALPLLLGALQRNAGSAGGARALLGALDRDHDGSILDDLAGFLGQGPSASGARSLEHILAAGWVRSRAWCRARAASAAARSRSCSPCWRRWCSVRSARCAAEATSIRAASATC